MAWRERTIDTLRIVRAGVAAFATILAFLLGGCGDGDETPCVATCPPFACTDPFAVTVVDESTRTAIADASGSSAGLACTASQGSLRCDTEGAPGTYDVELVAGYVSKQISVTVEPPPPPPGECECPTCQEWQPRSATLRRE